MVRRTYYNGYRIERVRNFVGCGVDSDGGSVGDRLKAQRCDRLTRRVAVGLLVACTTPVRQRAAHWGASVDAAGKPSGYPRPLERQFVELRWRIAWKAKS